MNQILNKVRDVDANNSDAVKDALSGFFQNLAKHSQSTSSIWLRALESVINRFPKYCMSHRNTIETYLVNFLDCKSYYNVIEAAKCAHALQQVRPSQEKTATPKVCWREQMELLCSAVHTLIGAVFTNDVYRNSGNYQKPNTESVVANTPLSKALADISVSPGAGTSQSTEEDDGRALLTLRLHNVFVFIQAMLVEVYPVGKPVRPQTILDASLRALTAGGGHGGRGQAADVIGLKTQALRTLDALAMCLGPNMIPFSPLVFRMVMQTLRWSSENPSEESRDVRCRAYGSLASWLTTLNCHAPDKGRTDASGKSFEDELTAFIVDDITPVTHRVQLTMSSQPTKHLSKKAKRKIANSMLKDSNMAACMPGEKNKGPITEKVTDDVAIAALECAEVFLTVCGLFLKPATHKILQERLIRECYRLDGYSMERALGLCRALEACRRSVPPGISPPTHYCLDLYSVLRTSRYQQISKLASQALLDIRLHLHCSPPSLNFAIEPAADAQKEMQHTQHEVSEKNRAALEQLLGATKVQAIIEQSEITTIVDEPAAKKPRLSEEHEKISVSSGCSVAISDEEDEVLTPTQIIIEDDQLPSEDFVKPTERDTADCHSKTEDLPQETPKRGTIYEASTQLPSNVNISGDTIDGRESPHSVEVAYDYPNTGKTTISVLEKLEEDNLPSSTETDDIQITCGQQIKSSQEVSQKKVDEPEVKGAEVKVNGFNEELPNGDSEGKVESCVTVKISEGVTVEDMLADFVDEVNEDVINVDS